MAKLSALRRIISIIAAAPILLLPVVLHADGVSLVADLEYFLTNQNSTDKATGILTDSESSRFSQLYRLDLVRQLYPNILFSLGGNYENDDTASEIHIADLPGLSSDTTERTIRPYVTVDLKDPIYRANLGYRTREVKTTRSFGEAESLMIDEYQGVFSWRPVDLPLLNVNYLRTEIQDDPLTIDSTRDVVNVLSRYTYRDFRFQYSFSGRDEYDNIRDSGSLTKNHNAGVDYRSGFDYKDNRFDVNAAARILQSSVEFSGAAAGDETVDTPAAEQGSPFYILNDSTPASNEPFELIVVEGGSQLTSVNIGRDGGISPVSAGLSFGIPTEVEAVYIELSNDTERFPELASPSQISAIADSFIWHFYSSDDQFELNWTEVPISSASFNTVDNRFEIRPASPVSARRIKVTTIPLTLLAPGEIRYQSIRAYTTLGSREPENLDQSYSFGLGWSPGERTTMGYEGSYRNQESEPDGSERTTWANSLYFRHVLNPLFSTYGRFYRTDRARSSKHGEAEDTDQSYSVAIRGDYLETLSQSLIFTGWDSNRSDEDSSSKSLLLRTNADLYEGWSMNIDLNYSLNTANGVDQTVRSLYLETNLQPNSWINVNFDYSVTWTEEADRIDNRNQYGTVQALWAITGTVNTFIRYSFRDQEGETDYSAYLREFSVNWSPFPDGDLSFIIGYSESLDEADQELKTISPGLTWKVSRGIFVELRHDTGTLESPRESIDFDSYIVKLRFFY